MHMHDLVDDLEQRLVVVHPAVLHFLWLAPAELAPKAGCGLVAPSLDHSTFHRAWGVSCRATAPLPGTAQQLRLGVFSHQPPANFCPLCRLSDQGGSHDVSEWRRTHDFGSSQRQAFMTEAADFFCPQCTSRYKLVRVRTEPPHATRTIHCKVCKESLPPTDGDYALKYFLVDKAKKHNGVDLRMKHSRGRSTAVQQQHQVQPKDGKL